MAETKVIDTTTILSVIGSAITIRSEYLNELPDTISVQIADEVGIQDGVSYIEGEGLIQMKNSPENISYILNNNGELILLTSTGDESNYSINGNGDLIYTTTE